MLRAIIVLLTCGLAWGQTFDVASVKPAAPPVPDSRGRILISPPSGGPGSKDPGRIRYPFTNLRTLITLAYDVKGLQVSGPAILDTERFEINATMPPDTTKEQFRAMLQNLLAERFKLTIHRESKELPMYSMVVAKGGSKLAESKDAPPKEGEDPPLPGPLASAPKMGPDGFPIMSVPAGAPIILFMMPGRVRLIGQQKALGELADRLTGLLNRTVVDATGLKAKYDFTLTFSSDGINGPGGGLLGPPPPPPPGAGPNVVVPEGEAPPDLFAAIQSQLGLKLEAKKGPVEMIVVDHVEKTPTEN